MKTLSLGRQEFSNLINENSVYVDKTADIFRLITEGRCYFLSRPRRFGKSLLVNTLKEIFLGNKHYFKDLWIENKIEWQQYPIIKLDMSAIGFKEIGLEKALKLCLKEIAESYQITLENETPNLQLLELIKKLSTSKQVVLLVDEYDKPIIDYLDDIPQAEKNRDLLKSFYSGIKSSDKLLKFVFLTGVAKFAKVSIFSDLNHLTDISVSEKYSKMLGYTQQELEYYFADRIENLQVKLNLTKIELLEQIKLWYNGYSWTGKINETVYNPFSILSFFEIERFDNFWFATGTPTFLTKILHKKFRFNIKDLQVDAISFDTHSLNNLDDIALLFQTGYLTIKKDLGFSMYELDYPNLEVRNSMMRFLLADFSQNHVGHIQSVIYRLYKSLLPEEPDFEEFFENLKTLFATIPYPIFIENSEKYYHSVIFLTLSLLDYFTQSEVMHNKGRLDMIVHFPTKIVIMEFKLDQTAQIALQQIKDKGYANPFLKTGKTVYLVGVNMEAEQKNITEYLVEKVHLPLGE
jgi:hypothetical protein